MTAIPTTLTTAPTTMTATPTTATPTALTTSPTTTAPTVYVAAAHRYYRLLLSTGPASGGETHVAEWSFSQLDGATIPIVASSAWNPVSSSSSAFDGDQSTSYRTLGATSPNYGQSICTAYICTHFIHL
jgi:hypothetical protein